MLVQAPPRLHPWAPAEPPLPAGVSVSPFVLGWHERLDGLSEERNPPPWGEQRRRKGRQETGHPPCCPDRSHQRETGREKGLGTERSVLAVGHTLAHISSGARTGAPPNQLPGSLCFLSLPASHRAPAGPLSPSAGPAAVAAVLLEPGPVCMYVTWARTRACIHAVRLRIRIARV